MENVEIAYCVFSQWFYAIKIGEQLVGLEASMFEFQFHG